MKRFALIAALLGALITISAEPASARYYYYRRPVARVVLPPYGVVAPRVFRPRVYAPGYYGYRPYVYGPAWGYYGYGPGWGYGYGPAWGYRPGAYVGIGVY